MRFPGNLLRSQVVAHIAGFLLAATAVIVTPGPDTALTIRNTLGGGRRRGVLTSAGVATGQAVWALMASAGLAAVLSASQAAFLSLRIVGAAYLAYLGLHSLLRAASRTDSVREQAVRVGGSVASDYRQGLLSNLGNPKMAVFFLSLLPQFAGHGGGSGLAVTGLGLVFAAMTFVWLSGTRPSLPVSAMPCGART